MRMTKVLLVDPDPGSAQTLSKGLADVGHDVVTASSGSAAVLMLEAERPDLVVSHAQAHDMDGFELFTLVRKDPTTMETPFLLIAGRNRPVALAAQEAGANLSVIIGDYTLELIVERVASLLATESVPIEAIIDRVGTGRTAEPLWAALDRAAAWQQEMFSLGEGFAGSLDVIDLAEVTQAIALGRKTGRLDVSLAAGAATILFDSGRVVHAESSGYVGEPAFATIISASQREHARFRFSRMDQADISGEPRTITRTVEQVLLDIAVGIDEDGEKMAHFEGASPRTAPGLRPT